MSSREGGHISSHAPLLNLTATQPKFNTWKFRARHKCAQNIQPRPVLQNGYERCRFLSNSGRRQCHPLHRLTHRKIWLGRRLRRQGTDISVLERRSTLSVTRLLLEGNRLGE